MPPKGKHQPAAKRVDTEGKRKPHNRSKSRAQRPAASTRPQAKKKSLSVSKLKRELRRVRFLLSKDTIGADARVEAERLEASLTADLVLAEEQARVAHTAQRYHKIKFIERTKVERTLAKLKRQLGSAGFSAERSNGTQSTRQLTEPASTLQSRIQDARILLHYILHFPPEKKYVSLLNADLSSSALREKHANSGNAALKEAMQFHQQMREQFESGELEPEPEAMLWERYELKRHNQSQNQSQSQTHPSRPSSGKDGSAPDSKRSVHRDSGTQSSLPDSDSDSDSESNVKSADENDTSSSASDNQSDASSDTDSDESNSPALPPPSERTRSKRPDPNSDSKLKHKLQSSSTPQAKTSKARKEPPKEDKKHKKAKKEDRILSAPLPAPEQAAPPPLDGDAFFDL